LFGQFGPHFCKIAFNRVLLTNGVKIGLRVKFLAMTLA